MSTDTRKRSKAQIEADMAAARARLSSNMETLIQEIHPKSIAQKGVDDVKTFARSEFTSARRHVRTDDGTWRWDTVLIAAGAIAGLIVFARVTKSGSKN